MTEQQEEKRYDQRDTTLKFVTRPDDISMLDDDPNTLRAEMSCGHAVTPQSLTAWCRSLLDQGQHKFRCPALIEDTIQKCNAEWSYLEVRRLAVLTSDEQKHFEETVAVLAAAEYCEYNSCPGCGSFVEREDLTNLCVLCTICTAERGKTYQFCWQCLREWKGPAPTANRCENPGCNNPNLEKLAKCRDVILPEAKNIVCPSMRACPTCGNLLEHDTTGCKNVICNRCQIEFCFVCLKLTPDCLETSSYYIACSDGVAPRQTSIPSWRK
ncbi:ankyrin repeat and IBR domain-containing protein 1 [Chanos chanos]|uniref:Ankyrin repeat and IBR domain-containing protein 1 n=1 Tax=Chanos chanos TaxID=29144 RepID=A0A6J2VY58_CHACN|nr:ankyrin repeat and IBR domain-containing protein 1-like [Chanos chanos]